MIISESTEVIKPSTIAELVDTYMKAEYKVKLAAASLEQAEASLKAAFGETGGSYFALDSIFRSHGFDTSNIEPVLSELRRQTWQALVSLIGVKRMMSVKRSEEIDQKLRHGKMEPINLETVTAMVNASFGSIGEFLDEAVKEVFDYLRPTRNVYKTNDVFVIGPKVIIAYAVERRYCGGGFQVHHFRQSLLTAMDNVFHLLDGKGTVKTHNGPLTDAIYDAAEDAAGETTYFKFKCFKNQNLHLEFKRLDLVEKINAKAGGMNLRPSNEKGQP